MLILLLIISILFSSVRNILSKNISKTAFGTKSFFGFQTLIFGAGGIFLVFTSSADLGKISAPLILSSVIYAAFLIIAQYCYTMALKSGKTGICATVYSLGFIFPTLSGVFWNEKISICDIIGICIAVCMIVLCKSGNEKGGKSKEKNYIFPLVMAMIASGGLGIMQKFQQNSEFSRQKSLFLIIAFALACIWSAVFYLIAPDGNSGESKKNKSKIAFCIGIVFAASNLCNTVLSGKLDAAVLFPALNIGAIIFSVLLGRIFYKEKNTKKDIAILGMGAVSIILLTV